MFVPILLGLDPMTIESNGQTAWQNSALARALDTGGYTDLDRFGLLRRADLTSLGFRDPNTNRTVHLPTYTVSQTLAVVCFYNYMRSKVESNDFFGSYEFLTTARRAFQEFLANTYLPDAPIKSWRAIQREGYGNEKVQLDNWNKQLRLSVKDFPIFKDPVFWVKHKRQFKVAVDSYSLGHLFDVNHVPPNLPLFQAQQGWAYKMLQETLQEPFCKSVVIKYASTKDTAII